MKSFKVPVVKEHGSWAVLILSCSAGIVTVVPDHVMAAEQGLLNETMITSAGFAFLVNSKSSLVPLLRNHDKRREHLVWFLLFAGTGLALLTPFLRDGIRTFAVFSPLPVLYVIFLYRKREHDLTAELLGFALLTISAPVTFFMLSGVLSERLYAAVYIFFAAGVLKVRVQTGRTVLYRSLMIMYCALSLPLFVLMEVSPYLLLPLAENVISSVWPRRERLRTTGNIELIKGVLFVILNAIFWR